MIFFTEHYNLLFGALFCELNCGAQFNSVCNILKICESRLKFTVVLYTDWLVLG
jgi:hypothetical protein